MSKFKLTASVIIVDYLKIGFRIFSGGLKQMAAAATGRVVRFCNTFREI